MNKFILIIFSISLTVLMTISCADNNTNANLSVEKQYITIDEFNNQLKLDEEKYQALLNYTNVLEEKIISLEKHQGELIFKIKRFQDDLQGVCDYKWEAFNIGINNGVEAGQSVMWPHVHLIPRRKGDLGYFENGTPYDPKGGVRNIIPHKGNYEG